MAKLKLLSTKTVFVLNVVVAIVSLLSYLTPYVSPKTFPLLAILSLTLWPLLVLNAVFVIYWLLRLKRRFWVSALVLGLGFYYINGFFQWSSSDAPPQEGVNSLKVMSFNVRLFEAYEPKPDPEVANKMSRLLQEESPDVLLIQEFYTLDQLPFNEFEHAYVHFKKGHRMGHAIFSKYPLSEKGAFDFPRTSNNTLYANVMVNGTEIRLYNTHLQSFKIPPSVSEIQKEDSEIFKSRIRSTLVKQQSQAEEILEHMNTTGLPIILAGDLNNTAFSYVYRKLSQSLNDSFIARGSGLGTTYSVDYIPLRIDYVFSSNEFAVQSFTTLDAQFSDHKAIMATLTWD